MSTKFTPGPWTVEDYRGPDTPDWRSTGLIWSRSEDEHFPGTRICQLNCDRLHSESPSEKIEEFEANARLVAAAPTMLEALENALGAFNERECSCDFEDGPDGPHGRACYYHRIEHDIKEAIRKATGERQ